MRQPTQIDKASPLIDDLDAAVSASSEAYPVALPLLRAWDNLPMSVRAAIAQQADDTRRARAMRLLVEQAKTRKPAPPRVHFGAACLALADAARELGMAVRALGRRARCR